MWPFKKRLQQATCWLCKEHMSKEQSYTLMMQYGDGAQPAEYTVCEQCVDILDEMKEEK